ncbi:hypothetical protein CRE_04183 [Caenorhabditis remanei]|uniref:F-box domain-containing protein n=1 Tax=Caenorhabditis remanei TaxID=31234 RepID=E3MYV3_CAERE|nr:hypothetical protein CRE_04183 [Caenorhabditis remanei]
MSALPILHFPTNTLTKIIDFLSVEEQLNLSKTSKSALKTVQTTTALYSYTLGIYYNDKFEIRLSQLLKTGIEVDSQLMRAGSSYSSKLENFIKRLATVYHKPTVCLTFSKGLSSTKLVTCTITLIKSLKLEIVSLRTHASWATSRHLNKLTTTKTIFFTHCKLDLLDLVRFLKRWMEGSQQEYVRLDGCQVRLKTIFGNLYGTRVRRVMLDGSATGTPDDSSAAGTPDDSSAAGTPCDSSAAYTPADSSAAGTPDDSSAAGTPADFSAAGTPADSSAAGTPDDSSASGTPVDFSAAGTPADSSAAGIPAYSCASCIPSNNLKHKIMTFSRPRWFPKGECFLVRQKNGREALVYQDETTNEDFVLRTDFHIIPDSREDSDSDSDDSDEEDTESETAGDCYSSDEYGDENYRLC